MEGSKAVLDRDYGKTGDHADLQADAGDWIEVTSLLPASRITYMLGNENHHLSHSH